MASRRIRNGKAIAEWLGQPGDFNKTITSEESRKVRTHQKMALTRAINSKNPEKIRDACKSAVVAWNAQGYWPDDWSRWQAALRYYGECDVDLEYL